MSGVRNLLRGGPRSTRLSQRLPKVSAASRNVERSCQAKCRYPTRKIAKERATTFMKDWQREAPPLRVYECRYCGGFHLTKDTANEQRTGHVGSASPHLGGG